MTPPAAVLAGARTTGMGGADKGLRGSMNRRNRPRARRFRSNTSPDIVARLCCTNGVRDSLLDASGVATAHERLPPCDVQEQEPAFVQHGAEAARFAIDPV